MFYGGSARLWAICSAKSVKGRGEKLIREMNILVKIGQNRVKIQKIFFPRESINLTRHIVSGPYRPPKPHIWRPCAFFEKKKISLLLPQKHPKMTKNFQKFFKKGLIPSCTPLEPYKINQTNDGPRPLTHTHMTSWRSLEGIFLTTSKFFSRAVKKKIF